MTSPEPGVADANGTPDEPPGGGRADNGGSTLASWTFAGFISTQFLGAFNDNYFKQMVLLHCAGLAAAGAVDRQPYAMAAFAVPFVLLSGFAGYLSDRFSKQRVIVLCKIAEIVVMACSLAALILPGVSDSGRVWLLIAVLGLMGSQSAFFGPSKYGALPELFRRDRLLPVNGAIQMTTFLAIIFGMAAAGIALEHLNRSLWLGSLIAVGIGVAGTLTSLLIRPLPAARPGLLINWDNLIIPRRTRQLLRSDRTLMGALMVSMVFWFIGGVTQPGVNTLGKSVFELSDTRTSLMALSVGVGIAFGCWLTGFVPAKRASRCMTVGAWCIVASFGLIALLSSQVFGQPASSGRPIEPILRSLLSADLLEWSLRSAMCLLGISAGAFVVPVQVFLQQAPPADQKGRLLGAMNLLTWIGIVCSAIFVLIADRSLAVIFGAESSDWYFLMFALLGLMMVPVALLYRLETPRGSADSHSGLADALSADISL